MSLEEDHRDKVPFSSHLVRGTHFDHDLLLLILALITWLIYYWILPYRWFVYSPIYLFIQSLTYSNIYSVAAAKSLQSCLTLCDPIDGSPPGSSVPGILQARTLEWVAISFSNIYSGYLYIYTLDPYILSYNPILLYLFWYLIVPALALGNTFS